MDNSEQNEYTILITKALLGTCNYVHTKGDIGNMFIICIAITPSIVNFWQVRKWAPVFILFTVLYYPASI